MLSKSKARLGVEWLERDEGDFDLRRERRGGRSGGGEGAGGMGWKEGVLLLTAPPPLSLPLCLSLSLPGEEEAA